MPDDPLVSVAVLGDPVVHLAEGLFPHFALCGAGTEHGKAWITPRVADCMTCLVRASRPSALEEISNQLAAAMRVPKEFLYGKDKDDGADDR